MSFTAGIYYDDEMRMNHYTLVVNMTTNSIDAVSHNVAFERLKFFVYNNLDSSIFIDASNTEKCQQFATAGLKITTMPGEPVDQLVGLMLYYKLNAIMEDRIIVDETEISSMLGENMTYLHSDNENTDIEYTPEWWLTSDTVHSDLAWIDVDKIVNMHTNNQWRELDLSWPESETSTATGNIVVFADFKHTNDTK
jgi:hypothetical protein